MQQRAEVRVSLQGSFFVALLGIMEIVSSFISWYNRGQIEHPQALDEEKR